MSLSLKGTVRKKMSVPVPENRNFNQRQSNLRSVLSPIENVRKCSQISTKSEKTDIFPSSAKIHLSPAGGNSLNKSKTQKNKPSSHGCVTMLDFHKKQNKLCQVSKTLPQKKLVLNMYQQKCHVARWKSWLADTPNWILQMGLESANDKISQNVRNNDKENSFYENEIINSSYVTIEDEVLEMSNNETVEPEDEKNDDLQNTVMDEENRKWKDWSIQLSDDGKLLVTGKTDDNVHQAKDVTSCELVDSNTLKFRNGVIYELMGMPDHFTNLPYYIRNKFQCGFPSDWKTVKEQWIRYIKEGSPFDFIWSTDNSPFSVTFNCDTSIEVHKRRSLIPVKSSVKAKSDLVDKFPHSELNTLVQTQPRGSPEPFKQLFSPALSECSKSVSTKVVKEFGNRITIEVKYTNKLDTSTESSSAY